MIELFDIIHLEDDEITRRLVEEIAKKFNLKKYKGVNSLAEFTETLKGSRARIYIIDELVPEINGMSIEQLASQAVTSIRSVDKYGAKIIIYSAYCESKIPDIVYVLKCGPSEFIKTIKRVINPTS